MILFLVLVVGFMYLISVDPMDRSKIAQNLDTYNSVSYKTILSEDADCLSSSLASTGRQVFYHIF